MTYRTRFMIVVALGLAIAAPASAGAAQERIVGGTPTTAPWPAQAYLSTPFDGCAGTLLSARWVLTAAHCITNVDGTVMSTSVLSVILGRSDISTATASDTYAVIAPIQRHPGFAVTNRGLTNDLALLHLDHPATVEPMRLVGPTETALWAPGTIATVLGWGTTCAHPCASVTQLRQAGVAMVGDAPCATSYNTPFPGSFNAATMVCAGTGEADTCRGDSGGPLLVPRVDAFVLAGVTSWGEGCADPSYPGVYARVGAPALIAWVRDLIPTAAIAVSPPSPSPGATATLTATSTKPASQPGTATYAWDLDDDGLFDDQTGTTASLPAIAPGSHVVRVRTSYADGDRAYAREVVTTLGSPPPPAPPPPPPPPKPTVPPAALAPPQAPGALRDTAPADAELTASGSVAIQPLAAFVAVPTRLRLRNVTTGAIAVRVRCSAACVVAGRLVLDGASALRAGLAKHSRSAVAVGGASDLRTRATTFTLTIKLTPLAVKGLRRLRRATLSLQVGARGGMRRETLTRALPYVR